MIDRVVPIVEGRGEVPAIRILLQRLMAEVNIHHVAIAPSDRNSRSSLLKPQYLEKVVNRAAESAGDNGAILILIDSDRDRPCVLGPTLLTRAKAARPDRRIMVALAEIEFETWFIAAAESLRGYSRLPQTLSRPSHFESIRGAKEWLTKQIEGSHQYKPTTSQASLTAQMDLDLARQHSASFRRFCNRFRELLA